MRAFLGAVLVDEGFEVVVARGEVRCGGGVGQRGEAGGEYFP